MLYKTNMPPKRCRVRKRCYGKNKYRHKESIDSCRNVDPMLKKLMFLSHLFILFYFIILLTIVFFMFLLTFVQYILFPTIVVLLTTMPNPHHNKVILSLTVLGILLIRRRQKEAPEGSQETEQGS